jgi:cyclitol reductase
LSRPGVLRVEIGPRGVELRRVAWPPTPKGSWAVLEPLVTGLCSSDLKEVRGTREVGSDFGHEVVARVHSTNVARLEARSRVCLDPHVGVVRSTAFGTAMFLSGTEAALERALPEAPRTAPDERAVFVEPLACAVHCAGRTGPARSVAIVGAGTAGVLLSVMLRLRGSRVTLVNRSARRLDALRGRQIVDGVRLVRLEEAELESHDTVVVTTTAMDETTFRRAWSLLAPEGGRLVLFGGIASTWRAPETDVAFDSIRRGEQEVHLTWDGRSAEVVGSHGATAGDFAEAVSVLDAPLPWSPRHVEELVGRRLDLEGLVTVLNRAREGLDPPEKCVVAIGRTISTT